MDYRTRIKEVREDRDLTQKQIGQIINKSQQGYNHIEAGRAELKINDLIALCKYYNLSADYLIGLSNTAKSYKE
ncbi:MAG: helix-turn-helix transcriptional regulator [Oscillospiraceae bacterium]|jgi:transcriptional regulator with XRE-family HTH domain|nr:helix-turn-helix transcriptional regulator [Oscillospiraceae bacterium]MDD7042351.1 helix-turn-helix transcriptional regulator [Oscillospiraceae bacterium]MDY2610503.1 helix-turn-helix transcriptional regulator [Oscillospiraceae bacterium]